VARALQHLMTAIANAAGEAMNEGALNQDRESAFSHPLDQRSLGVATRRALTRPAGDSAGKPP
jgi:hypothetical protein